MNILVLCTGNSARSILGEVLFNHKSNGSITGYSAGSQPAGQVNPAALQLLSIKGHDTSALRSKSWDEFSEIDAPHMDAVITVCSSAAGETCPIWPGTPVRAHWGFPDPAAVTESEFAKQEAFALIYDALAANIDRFLRAYSPEMDQRLLMDCLAAAHRPLGEDKDFG